MKNPKTICSAPGCVALVDSGRCEKHKKQTSIPDNRPSPDKRGYDARWKKLSRRFRAENPLCRECEKQGRITAAECVDHIVPHCGNVSLIYDVENLQSLCWSCHSRKTRKECARK